jgi:hypothetical protein
VTYVELVAEIQNYTQNYETSFVDTIPTFVTQAEERIYNSVQIPSLRKNVTGGVTAGNKYLSCPTDYLSTFSLAVIDADGNYEYLLNKDVNYIRAAYPNPTDEGLPKYYALFGPTVISSITTDELSFILGPTPDDAYDVELHYYYYPQSITTAGTSWLGDNYSPVLLYGSLREAYLYMKGEQDIITYYEKMYQEAMSQLNRLGTGLERGDAYRDGQAKIKVNP